MAKTKRNKKFLIVLLIALLLTLAVGYAAFSDTLEISGTAKVTGTFDIHFVPAECKVLGTPVGCNPTVTVTTDSNSEANDKVVVAVNDLAYPGAGAHIQVQVKNDGTIPVKINSVSPSNISGNTNAIVIDGLDDITAEHPTIPAGGYCTFSFTVEWPENATTLNNSLAGENGNNFSFGLDINYIQDTAAAFSANTIHTHTS